MEETPYNNREDPSPAITSPILGRPKSKHELEIKNTRGDSPRREANDSLWQKYLSMVADEKGATALRSDPAFLDNLLKVLETNINEIVRVG